MSYRMVIGVVVLAAVLAGCGTEKDSWLSGVPGERLSELSHATSVKFVRVKPEAVKEAENRLADGSYVKVTSTDAAALTGEAQGSSDLYLVRGVMLNKENGKFAVSLLADGAIEVYFQCWGGWPVSLRRQPLVVELAKPPSNVYVSCHMTE